MKEKILIALRWIFFLPVSILGAWLITIVASWLNKSASGTGFMTNLEVLWNYGVDIISNAVMGAMYMYIGYFMVPSHKKVVGLCMFGLACIICGGSIMANILNGFSWFPLICALFMIGGAGYVYYLIGRDELD